MLTNNIGSSIEDLKYNYTIDQIYLFYEKCVRDELDDYKMQAQLMVNSLTYTSPNIDPKRRNSVQRNWQRFIDALTWDKIKNKRKKQSPQSIMKAFNLAGVPEQKKVK